MANDVTSKVILGLDPSEFRRGIQQVDAKLKQTSRLFGNLGQAIGAAFAVSQIQAFATEAIALGSQLETVRKGFERFGDVSTLGELRKATRGLVTDLDLMKVAVQAGNFGIPIQQMGQLLEFAARRAAETGQSVDYLVESIVTGIGRKSPLILDNLGISAVALKEKFGGAALEAQSIADVAKAVGEIATAELAKMGEATDTAADKMQRLATSWDNFKARFGEAVAPAVTGVLDFISGTLERTFINFQLLKAELHTTKPSERIKSRAPMGVAAPVSGTTTAAETPFSPQKVKLISLAAKEMGSFGTVSLEAGQVLRSSTIPAIETAEQQIEKIRTSLEFYNAEMAMLNQIGAQFGSIFTGAFQAALNNGTSFFDEIKNALKAYIQQMIIAVGVTAALAAVMTALRPGLSFGKAFQGIAGGTGLGSIFGEGGIVELFTTIKGFDLNATTNRVNGVLNLTR